MNKYFKYVLFLIVITINIPNVKAEMCDNEDLTRLRVLDERVTVDSSYTGDKIGSYGLQEYMVKFNNLGNEFYVLFDDYIYHDNEEVRTFSGHNSFNIYSTDCEVRVRTIEIDLLKYNECSSWAECSDLKDKVEECYEWFQGDISEDDFLKKIDSYNGNDNGDNNKYLDIMVNIFTSYWYFIIPFVIGLIFVITAINIRRNRLD